VEKIAEKYSDNGDTGIYFAAQLGDIILRIKTKFAIFTLMGIAATVLGAVFLHELTASEKENRAEHQDDIDQVRNEVTWTF